MRTVVRFLPVILVPLLAGCYSMNIECYYPDNYDFSKLKTFDTKMREAMPDGESLEGFTFFETKIQEAIKNDLETKGFHNESEGESDFQVVIHIWMCDQTVAGSRELWGQWIYAESKRWSYQYEAEGVFIEVVDNHAARAIWRGSAEPFGPGLGLSEKKIAKTVKKILADFPPARN